MTSTHVDAVRTDRLSVPQYAEYLGISVTTAYKWRTAGIGPQTYRIGNRVYADRADLDSWIEQQKTRTARGA